MQWVIGFEALNSWSHNNFFLISDRHLMELRILQTVKIKKQLRVERIKYWVFFYILVEESEVRIQPDHKIYVDIGLLVVLHYEIIDDVRFLFLCTLFHFVTERECKHLDLF